MPLQTLKEITKSNVADRQEPFNSLKLNMTQFIQYSPLHENIPFNFRNIKKTPDIELPPKVRPIIKPLEVDSFTGALLIIIFCLL